MNELVIELGVLFYLCSFLGFIYELILTYIFTNKIFSHGMFRGPFLPIYGIGSILIVLFLNKYKKDILKFLIYTYLITGTFEYISGLFILKFLKMRLWDYTEYPLNINGLVCPLSALCFTIGGVIIIYEIYPKIKKVVKNSNKKILQFLLLGISIIFSNNIIATLKN